MADATDHPRPQAGSAAVVGRYQLVGVNGGLLPVTLEADDSGSAMDGCSVLAGELRLEDDGSYVLELTARSDRPPGAGVRTIASGGSWRFFPSALDRTSGEIRLSSGADQTSAAVAGVSLVHRIRRPERHPGGQAHWVYIRR